MDTQQNKIAFITGVSSGIGEALANLLLSEHYTVIGIGRTCSIQHPNFTFQYIDLSDSNSLTKFEFNESNAESVLLINNAGIVGDIAPIGELSSDSIQEIMTTNIIAPQILCNKFIHTFLSKIPHLHIINISSGAGKRPIDAWATYCSSKAALDLFSSTIYEEMATRNVKNFHIHSVAPGVVDTKMQEKIRSASPKKFLASQRFHDLKNNNELSTPDSVANRLLILIKNPEKTTNCIVSLNEIV